MVILFCVNVPVLSEHTIEVLPNVSTAGNLRIMACCLTILVTLTAKTIVTVAASPSGTAATAKATAVLNDSNQLIPLNDSRINTITQITIQSNPIVLPISFNLTCKGVNSFSLAFNMPAILPTSFFIPVDVTIASPRP